MSDIIEGLAPGDRLPDFVRTTGLDIWNRYAAVNNEFVPMHMADEAGKRAGYAAAFGMGNLQWAYLHNVVRDWIGCHGRLERISTQFRSPDIGSQVTAYGTVTEVGEPSSDGRVRVELAVGVRDAEGKDLSIGTATVTIRARS